MNDEFVAAGLDQRDPGKLADFIAQNVTLRHEDRQKILEELNPVRRLKAVNTILSHEGEGLQIEMDLEVKVRARVARVQKDMILREQVKVLQHELGDDGDMEIDEYNEKIAKLMEGMDVDEPWSYQGPLLLFHERCPQQDCRPEWKESLQQHPRDDRL